jgi:hypothetical protein
LVHCHDDSESVSLTSCWMKNPILELIGPNLNILSLSFDVTMFPLNLIISKITQFDHCLGMPSAFGMPCQMYESGLWMFHVALSLRQR